LHPTDLPLHHQRSRTISHRPLHPVYPTGWPRRRSGCRIGLATTPTHVPCTEAGSLPFRACPPRGTTGLQPVVKRRGGPAVVRAIAPHTDSRGRTTLGLPMRRHVQHGEGGDRAGPILGPPCGDNRQTHLGGRGPPGCSGERDRWLPLGSDDFNARTQV